MPGQGLQHIPLRIPEKWDAAWYARHLREVLALADTRNAIEGSGITISGQPGEEATISASDDLQNLLLQTYVLASPSGFLNFERILAEGDGIEIIDGGANANITVGIEDRAVNLGKLVELSNAGILGNPVDDVGAVQNINPEQTLAVLHYSTAGGIEFDLIDHTYVSDFDEAAQDSVGGILANSSSVTLAYNDGTPSITAAIIDEYVQDLVGAMATDSTNIDFSYNDLAGTLTATVVYANPSGLIGMTAANGTSLFSTRADATHAIDPAIAPIWTGVHEFTGSSGAARILVNTTSGNDLIELRASGAAKAYLAVDANGAGFFSGSGETGNGFYTSGSVGVLFQINNTIVGRWQQTTGNLDVLLDSQEIRIGASQDFRLFHNGTNSIIRNDTGALRLQGSTNIGLEIAATGAISSTQIATWSGRHTFTANGVANNSAITLDNSVNPFLGWRQGGASADQRNWDMGPDSGTFLFRAVNDAISAARNIFEVTHGTGVELGDIRVGNATSNNTVTCLGTGGLDVGGTVRTVASATARAGLRLPHGAAPTTPTNGDMWTTTAGLFVRINGATVGPLS